ncbi:MAG: hypothetical protein ACLQGT_04575 [Terracidiphilus sp.]
MQPITRSSSIARGVFAFALSCWNWKCALLSAAARSIVYVVALSHTGRHGGLSIVLVEMAYVTLTAGIYAGMQQKALSLRNRLAGNLIVVLCVPGLAQLLDWLAHRVVGAAVPNRTILAVCIFTLVSALFHLHVMRRGVFLTNHRGRSLIEDFRRMPRLIAGFVAAPVIFLSSLAARMNNAAEADVAL